MTLFVATALVSCSGGGGSAGSANDATNPGSTVSVSAKSLAFMAVTNAALPATQDIQLTVNRAPPYIAGVAYPPGVTPVSWLNVTASGASSPFTFHVSMKTASLSPGTYSTTVGVGIAESDGTIIAYEPVAISYVVTGIGGAPGTLSFEYERGQPAPQKLFSLLGSGSWSAATDSWIRLNTSSGSLPTTLEASVDPTALASFAAGNYSGAITFTRAGTGEKVTVNVSLTNYAGSHRLRVTDEGVAFATMPGLSNLTRTIRVNDNFGIATNWSASANQSWLSVTPSGTTPDSLVLTADVTGLASNNVYTATVSVTSNDGTIQNARTINVGLWVGSAAPTSPTTVSGTFAEVVTDPVRPYAYVHSSGTTVAVYNVYTGTLVSTISSVAAKVGKMAISSDGNRLFVADDVNYTVVPVDLTNFTVGTAWASGAKASGLYLVYTRSNDMGLILTSNGNLFQADTGVKLSQTFQVGSYGFPEIPAASKDGTRLCSVTTQLSPYTVTCQTLFYGYSTGGSAVLGRSKSGAVQVGGNARDIALNTDGSLVYVAAGAPYDFYAYDAATLSLAMPTAQIFSAAAYPNNIEIAANGKVFGGIDTTDTNDVWIYDTTGTPPPYTTFDTGELLPRQLALSGDSLRMVTIEKGSISNPLVMRTVP